ncbi:putative tRNA threonylcarbamoyladenosine biosynthesis protein kae1 [Mucor velutinosus]|uniref:tRNA threonylcarbamoyladenosine biosynthesis protein kae1 n=1 Tax=Mucor velutinosus TaxID=708070 RepID=A0AAN7I0I0_9FUNG|nr:putative tRNA threonylcarbamoyladenosine biosynthesis protein kae1 [Mucor velutinosus]
MKKYPHMLIKPPSKKVTESDYLQCIWSRILEAMFPPEKNIIRIKSGESVNSASNINKNEQYNGASYIKSSKIDFRLLVDVHNDQIDVGAGECALNNADDKAITDEGKLTRETKDALDEIIKLVPEDLNDATCWGMQFAGSHCTMTSIHLESQGLYVNMHRHEFNIPSSYSSLENFGPTIAWLLTMRQHMLRLDEIIKRHKTPEHSNCVSFNRRQAHSPNHKLSYIRDTYYTPPRNHKSKLPMFMFRNAPASTPESSAAPRAPSQASNTAITIVPGEPDKNGYIDQRNGTYYNIHTKKLYDYHPLIDTNVNEEDDD